MNSRPRTDDAASRPYPARWLDCLKLDDLWLARPSVRLHGKLASMMVTVDRVGRLVIPKAARDRLSLGPDTELDLSLEGNSIRLTPVRVPSRAVELVDGFPRIEPVAGVTTTDADVQEWRDADRR